MVDVNNISEFEETYMNFTKDNSKNVEEGLAFEKEIWVVFVTIMLISGFFVVDEE